MAIRRGSVRRWLIALTILITVVSLVRVGPREAWSALLATWTIARGLPRTALLAAVGLALVQNVLAILRLHVLARPPGSPLDTVRRLALPHFLNAIAPARAGDLAKIAVVAEHGGVARATGSVLVADKVADVAAGAGALLFGALASGVQVSAAAWRGIFLVLVGGFVAAVIAHVVIGRTPRVGRLRRTIADLLRSLASPRRMVIAFAIAWTCWLTEATALAVVAHGAGASLSTAGALFSLAVLNVGILVPILPGNAGTFEFALGLALGRLGVAAPTALAIAAVHHAAQLFAAGGLALLATFIGRNRTVRGISEEAKTRAIASYDRRAPRYEQLVSAGPLRWLRARERRAVLDLARLDDPAIRTVIDVGCGDGYYTRAAKRAGKMVHAVDAAPGMVERVRSVADRAFVADLDVLELDARYDVVLCCGVLEFVTHPEVAFAHLCRLCAPGGRVVLLVPSAGAAGLLYWIEKRLAGLTVNLYRTRWLDEHASTNGLALARVRHPLPINQVLLFESTPPR